MNKYQNLPGFLSFLRFFAWLIIIGCVLSGIFLVTDALDSVTKIDLSGRAAVIVAGMFTALLLFCLIEMLDLLMDIEANTRRAATQSMPIEKPKEVSQTAATS